MDNLEKNIDKDEYSDEELELDIDFSFGLGEKNLTCEQHNGPENDNQINDHLKNITEAQKEFPLTTCDPPDESLQRTQNTFANPSITSILYGRGGKETNLNEATESQETNIDEALSQTSPEYLDNLEFSTSNKEDDNREVFNVNLGKDSVLSPPCTSKQAATFCSRTAQSNNVDVSRNTNFISSLQNFTKKNESPQNEILPLSFPNIASTEYSGVPPFYVSSSDIERDLKVVTEAVSLHQSEIQRLMLEAERNERQKQENLTQISLLTQKRSRIKTLDDLTESCVHICHGNIQKAEEFSQEASLFALNTLINCLENKKIDIKVEVNRFMEKFGISTTSGPSTLDPETLLTDVANTRTPGTSKTPLTMESNLQSLLKTIDVPLINTDDNQPHKKKRK